MHIHPNFQLIPFSGLSGKGETVQTFCGLKETEIMS